MKLEKKREVVDRLTYKDSGVDIEKGDSCSKIFYEASKKTFVNRIGRFGEPKILENGFSGPIFIDKMENAYLVKNCDGVGTKVEIAQRINKHDTIAHDLIAMVADDAVCIGAEPFAAINTVDWREADPKVAQELAKGMVEACAAAKIAMVGGESAELRDAVGGFTNNAYNWSAEVTGILEQSKMIDSSKVDAGDYLVGLKSDGFRSNGFSLARHILTKKFGDHWHNVEFGFEQGNKVSWGEQLLKPSKIFCQAILDMIGRYKEEAKADIHGVTHITGGGIPGNLRRILGSRGAIINNCFQPHAAMLELMELGNIETREAYKTWNMGCGMIIATPDPHKVITIALSHGIEAQAIGTVSSDPRIRIRTMGTELIFEHGEKRHRQETAGVQEHQDQRAEQHNRQEHRAEQPEIEEERAAKYHQQEHRAEQPAESDEERSKENKTQSEDEEVIIEAAVIEDENNEVHQKEDNQAEEIEQDQEYEIETAEVDSIGDKKQTENSEADIEAEKKNKYSIDEIELEACSEEDAEEELEEKEQRVQDETVQNDHEASSEEVLADIEEEEEEEEEEEGNEVDKEQPQVIPEEEEEEEGNEVDKEQPQVIPEEEEEEGNEVDKEQPQVIPEEEEEGNEVDKEQPQVIPEEEEEEGNEVDKGQPQVIPEEEEEEEEKQDQEEADIELVEESAQEAKQELTEQITPDEHSEEKIQEQREEPESEQAEDEVIVEFDDKDTEEPDKEQREEKDTQGQITAARAEQDRTGLQELEQDKLEIEEEIHIKQQAPEEKCETQEDRKKEDDQKEADDYAAVVEVDEKEKTRQQTQESYIKVDQEAQDCFIKPDGAAQENKEENEKKEDCIIKMDQDVTTDSKQNDIREEKEQEEQIIKISETDERKQPEEEPEIIEIGEHIVKKLLEGQQKAQQRKEKIHQPQLEPSQQDKEPASGENTQEEKQPDTQEENEQLKELEDKQHQEQQYAQQTQRENTDPSQTDSADTDSSKERKQQQEESDSEIANEKQATLIPEDEIKRLKEEKQKIEELKKLEEASIEKPSVTFTKPLAKYELYEQVDFKEMQDNELKEYLKEHKIGLNIDEARKIQDLLGRPPTLTEAIIWGIQGSEHCSYRSSKKLLKMLPTQSSVVIQGPAEDAGIVEIAKEGDQRYGIVIGHESHNHPSQIVPYEGAATGVGGIVRDVCCMGAKVIGALDSLRFGDAKGKKGRTVKRIAEDVVDGIAGYGNPIGVPNLGGDTYFNARNDDNCLVNAIAIGLIKESEIIHSRAAKEAGKEKHDIIAVGKATDNSGMGGASFASAALDEKEKESNKGAVQEPNPFLKRCLFEATYSVFKKVREKGITHKVGFKDCGAGGIMCASVELVDSVGLGAFIDISKVHTGIDYLHPAIISCAETQERFVWTCPKSFTPTILATYNNEFNLPGTSEGAKARVIGEVTNEKYYTLIYDGKVICDANSADITEGLQYDRISKQRDYSHLEEPEFKMPDCTEMLLRLLESENICSKHKIFNKYDKSVQGNTVIEAGKADAGVIMPFAGIKDAPEAIKNTGVAIKSDGNSRYGLISPYWQAANAVAEAMRNVACVGAEPLAITDCCNYGNPEVPEEFWELEQGIKGASTACKEIGIFTGEPLAAISGNVSLYNYSHDENGTTSIPPSMVICCVGKMRDVSIACTPEFKAPNNAIFLIGERKDEMGGSEYYHMNGYLGRKVPTVDFKQCRREIDAVIDCIRNYVTKSVHDISEGGIAVALAEMCIIDENSTIGADVTIPAQWLREDKWLFGQNGGFAVEVNEDDIPRFINICKQHRVVPLRIGSTNSTGAFTVKKKLLVRAEAGQSGDNTIISTNIEDMREKWLNGYDKVIS